MKRFPSIIQPFRFFIMISAMILLGLSGGAAAYEVTAETGDNVTVYYSLSFPDGPIFETNVNDTPLMFTLGSGAMILGFDKAIHGMKKGETKTVIIPPEEAYGEINESLIRTIPLHEAMQLLQSMNNENMTISLLPGYPGPMIEYLPPEGKRQRYVFTNITNETVTMDTNRPLVGKSLQFEITLSDIGKIK